MSLFTPVADAQLPGHFHSVDAATVLAISPATAATMGIIIVGLGAVGLILGLAVLALSRRRRRTRH
ncbi:MAG: LPXTG cell wall anchor domain-containing protein [Lacisediminihabitans sp.]